ncbi:class I SAM-dependent methyltransferase [Methylocystis bryophila]|uniref:Methyltransferase type 12 n=1 Tax=Methylocystis bryophila TaxID=655015 RepID=A0A1W6MVF1_9HYPH|nr:class I SAM-dependent methyltransferase [Methylocystis bryophila]ARN81496.1 hypothetical protein B1812_10915 [Methylocystis bryophila]BDV37518.1 hypothetical protein DSM21852_07710 [Methylocystis bryophila]
MSSGYFEFTRSEIAPLLPQTASRILDVGCGAGATSLWLKTKYPDARLTGIEVNPELRPELEKKLDEVHIVDLNSTMPSFEAPDLVLFLDVLEHLANPKEVLRRMLGKFSRDVTVIVSLPNIAHASVSIPLFFQGRFDYADAGILDRTHLTFFYRDSAVALLNEAGLKVSHGLEAGFSGPKSRLLDRLTFGRLRDRLAKQYIMCAQIMPIGHRQGPIVWSPV